MKKIILIAVAALSLLAFSSCKKGVNVSDYPKLIIGSWELVQRDYYDGEKWDKMPIEVPETHVFKEDGTFQIIAEGEGTWEYKYKVEGALMVLINEEDSMVYNIETLNSSELILTASKEGEAIKETFKKK
ncbi:MAG: hypothetical protein HUJ98_11625 [Bacteroidaceae bacterium]|nr:hypothetical protein [Bacteroidales bacterium]MCF0187125.1 hypothetical protein [Bacteroidaceae bacterium]